MAKKPDQRHSKDKRDPVTIDLDSSDVTRIEEEKAGADQGSETEAVATANAVPVPALNGFTLAALAALMAGLGLWMRRRFVKG